MGTNYPLDHLPQAIPITTLSTDASEKTSFSLLLLLGFRSKGQRTDRQRAPCQITDVMKFRSRIVLTSFRGPDLSHVTTVRDFSHLFIERDPHAFDYCACCYRCCPLAAATPCPTLPFNDCKIPLPHPLSLSAED
jgi:hypothetical protein